MDYKTNVGMLEVRFFDNETGLGFLINQPGISPVIYLNRTLLGEDQTELMFQEVYGKLLDLHHTMNVWERVVPFVKYYEELVPPIETHSILPEPEIAFIGVAVWRERVFTRQDNIRIIGGAFVPLGDDKAG
jgi:hypothetical protein